MVLIASCARKSAEAENGGKSENPRRSLRAQPVARNPSGLSSCEWRLFHSQRSAMSDDDFN